jgi:hypothetical protein
MSHLIVWKILTDVSGNVARVEEVRNAYRILGNIV